MNESPSAAKSLWGWLFKRLPLKNLKVWYIKSYPGVLGIAFLMHIKDICGMKGIEALINNHRYLYTRYS